jgi:GYF domain 2
MFREAYYVRILGEQKGPYTFIELRRLYEHGFFPEEALFWEDGMEQWLPVSELCGPPLREKKRRARVRLIVRGTVAAALLILLAAFAPVAIDGWREAAQHPKFDAPAAYWRARGFVRGELKKQNANVYFERFNARRVSLDEKNRAAEVTLPCIVYPKGKPNRNTAWRATVRFDSAQRQWSVVAAREEK